MQVSKLHPVSPRGAPRRRRWRLPGVLVSAITAVVLVGCTSGGEPAPPAGAPTLTIPEPELDQEVATVTVPEGFVMPDTRGARLLPVTGRPRAQPPVPVFGGTGSLRGAVQGPDGPVPGATVRLERFVGDRSGTAQVTAGTDGRWTANRVHGGRYRVRAWLPPELTATQAEVLFLGAGASAEVVVQLERFGGVQLEAGFTVSVVSVGEQATVRALLAQATVGGDGIVSATPVAGTELRLSSEGGFTIEGANPASTDGDGTATWSVRCDREGTHRLTVSGPDVAAAVRTPACTPQAAPPVTTDVPAFPVGAVFTVPRAAALPPGTYRASAEACAFTYEAYENGAWQAGRREARGQIVVLTTPARDLRPVAGTDGCSYERVS
jgi:hypothetical protein